MTALAGARLFGSNSGGNPVLSRGFIGLAANAKVWQGAVVCLDPATGFGTQGKTAPGLIVLGVAEPPNQNVVVAGQPPAAFSNLYDNTGGTNGLVVCEYSQGARPFLNSAGGDAITAAAIGQDCYMVDDQTAALTDGAGTRSRLGRIVGFETQPVVQVGASFAGAQPTMVLTVPVALSSLVVGGGTFAQLPALGFNGKIKSLAYVPQVAGAGAGATFAVTAQIAGVSTTGGIATITLANTGQGAASVLGTAVTALNGFTGAQVISLINAAGTVFTGGSGAFIIEVVAAF